MPGAQCIVVFMNDTKRSAGKLMMNHLAQKGKGTKKAGTASTEELAAVAGIPGAPAYTLPPASTGAKPRMASLRALERESPVCGVWLASDENF